MKTQIRYTQPIWVLEELKRNLKLDTDDVVGYCISKIKDKNAKISRKGKNYYVEADGCIITVNASSYTIITAHLK